MPVEDNTEGVGEIVDGVHAGHLAGGYERGKHCPVLDAELIADEGAVLTCQRDWTDLVFDRVGIEFEGAVFEEAGQAGSASESVVNFIGKAHRQKLGLHGQK